MERPDMDEYESLKLYVIDMNKYCDWLENQNDKLIRSNTTLTLKLKEKLNESSRTT